MSVDGSRRPGRNTRMQYTYILVFKQECVVVGCGDKGIQRIRPWPQFVPFCRSSGAQTSFHSVPLMSE